MSESVDVIYAEGETFTQSYLHITGDDNIIRGDNCVIQGNQNEVDGDQCTVMGYKNNVSGDNCAVIGHDNLISGDRNHVTGNYNFLTGNECHASGMANTLTGVNCTAEGSGNMLGRPAPNMTSDEYQNFVAPYIPQFASSVAVTPRTDPLIPCPSQEDAQNDIKAESDATNVCIICRENIPQAVAVPCMHLSYCLGCARTMCCVPSSSSSSVACAKCRQPATSLTRIFLES